MAFPTLTTSPKSIPVSVVDDTIKTDFEAGYTQTRPRFTRMKHKFGPIKYVINRADLDLLIVHDATVKGSTSFSWTNADTGTTYTVRYSSDGRLKYDSVTDSSPNNRFYNVEFSLEDV